MWPVLFFLARTQMKRSMMWVEDMEDMEDMLIPRCGDLYERF